MADKNTDFLKFNAYSIKDLITRKLSENSKFTDQIYEGSNIAVLIDLVSYMYQCLLYNLNNSSSEALFSDTQQYENIMRLISLIGYNPNGCVPSQLNAFLSYSANVDEKLPCLRYTRFDTGKTDSNGKHIYFSVANDISFDNDYQVDAILFNGCYKMYSQVFVASGIENEVLQLNSIGSDSENNRYVPKQFIDVYVLHTDETGAEKITKWTNDINGIFTRSKDIRFIETDNTIYSSKDESDNVYTVRLTEDKTYEIKFGDGITGRKLNPNDRVIVMYLDSNGPDGYIESSELNYDTIKIEHNPQMFGMSKTLYNQMFYNVNSTDNLSSYGNLSVAQIQTTASSTSKFQEEETVDQIRETAPNWFKTGNRLITRQDYEYFIKNNIDLKQHMNINNVIDVKCMNNIEYVSSFYKWLYINGKTRFPDDPKHYFKQNFWSRTEYQNIDPADQNNVYLWIKSDNVNDFDESYKVASLTQTLNNYLKPIKTLTTEIQVCKPVLVAFDICANDLEDDVRSKIQTYGNANTDNTSYIEITVNDDQIFTNVSLQQTIADKIIEYFKPENCQLGQNVSVNDLENLLYLVHGVQSIRTVYKKNDNDDVKTRIYNGLSFASWSILLDEQDDLVIGGGNRKMNDFQFPVLLTNRNNLINSIKIIRKQLTSVNTLKM